MMADTICGADAETVGGEGAEAAGMAAPRAYGAAAPPNTAGGAETRADGANGPSERTALSREWRLGLPEGVVLALIPVGGVGAAYVEQRAYLLHFGVPDWAIRAPDAADVSEAIVPLVVLAAMACGVVLFLSAAWTRVGVGSALFAVGVMQAMHALDGGRDPRAGCWTALVGVLLVLLGVMPPILNWASRRWPSRADRPTNAAASVPANRQPDTWPVGHVLAAVAVFAFVLLLGATGWGEFRAGIQNRFDVAGNAGEWVILRRSGDQLLAAQRDTTDDNRLRLTGEYALLKAIPDSEPVVVRRRVLRQDSLTAVDVAGTAQAATPALVMERLRERVLGILRESEQEDQPARVLAGRSTAGPSAVGCSGAGGTTSRRPALADSLASLIAVERRRASAWRVTYQLRRGSLRGDSIRVPVRDAPTVQAAVCRGNSLLASAFGAASARAPTRTSTRSDPRLRATRKHP